MEEGQEEELKETSTIPHEESAYRDFFAIPSESVNNVKEVSKTKPRICESLSDRVTESLGMWW